MTPLGCLPISDYPSNRMHGLPSVAPFYPSDRWSFSSFVKGPYFFSSFPFQDPLPYVSLVDPRPESPWAVCLPHHRLLEHCVSRLMMMLRFSGLLHSVTFPDLLDDTANFLCPCGLFPLLLLTTDHSCCSSLCVSAYPPLCPQSGSTLYLRDPFAGFRVVRT